MRDRSCKICLQRGIDKPAHYVDQIYNKKVSGEDIHLCYSHSVELFKTGQRNFISKYKFEYDFNDYNERKKDDPLRNYFVFNSFA